MPEKQTGYSRGRRMLISLLLAVSLAAGLVAFSRAEAGSELETGALPLNTSGGVNRAPSVDLVGGNGAYIAEVYNSRNGLPTSEANAIAQTGDGFIWIGSYAGLIRYDGNNFERIDDETGISNVRCLYVDSRDRLWIGTNDAGILLMENGAFRRWTRADGLDAVSIRSFSEDGDGNIYIGSITGVSILDPDMNLTVLQDDQAGQTVLELRRGSGGVVYALTADGDLAAYRGGKQVSRMRHEDSFIADISCMLPDPDRPGWFWIGTSDSGAYYGEAEKCFQNPETLDLGDLTYPKRLEMIDGRVWGCGRNGTGRLEGNRFIQPENLPMDNSIQNVMTDYQGNLWFTSTRQGVMKVTPNMFADMYALWELPAEVVNSTCLLDAIMFIGTDEGLAAIRDGEKVDRIPLAKAATASGREIDATDLLAYLDKVRIRSVIRDSKNRLWISPWNGDGLVLYADGEMTVFTPEDGMASDKCRMVWECTDGTILAAQSGGLSVIQDGRVAATYGKDEGITNEGILTVTEGMNGEYILGTDGGGIFIIRSGKVSHIVTEDGLGSDVVMRLYRSRSENVFWIVTGNSLAFLSPDGRVTTVRDFPYANNYDVFESSKGELWVLASGGIYTVPVKQMLANGEIDAVHYNYHSGLPYTATANSYSELTGDGDLFIAGNEGIIHVNIENHYESNETVRLVLPYIDCDGKRIYPDEGRSFSLPAGAKKITIYPYVLNYMQSDPQVSYRLEGFDAAEATVRHSMLQPVDYTNLPGGSYTFFLRSGGREISISLEKAKTVFEHPLFWVAIVLALLAADVLLIRWLLKRKARRVEAKKENERVSRELQMAREIQSNALPQVFPPFPDRTEFELYASMTPAKEVGGDFYDFFLVDDDHLALVIADVSDKGVPAAMFMMRTKSLIKNELLNGNDPARALALANQQLREGNASMTFVTVWLAVVELSTGRGTACNAGHENPVLYRAGEKFELLKYDHDTFVGARKKAEYHNREFRLNPGDCLFVYTDGVPEAINAAGEMFGEERLAETLNQASDTSPEALVRAVHDAVDRFAGSVPQFDDTTMLCYRQL